MHCYTAIGLGSILFLLAGCAGPAPIVIYEDKQESIWLKFDPKAGSGHSHPATISTEQMANLLNGVRVTDRNVVTGFELFKDIASVPAFSGFGISRLAPYLSQALKKASPQDMVTFYLATFDPSRGMLVTSGGLFVRNERVYFILANARTSPSTVQYENTYEINTRDQPLLPITRWKFSVLFTPQEAWIPNKHVRGTDGYEEYLDDSKLLVIDLKKLSMEPQPSTLRGAPPDSKPNF